MALTQVSSGGIQDGAISDVDIASNAAIAGSKVSPDFGSQNVTTTGAVTGASLIPSGSTAPTNGVYLPAANSVALSTNGTGRLFVDASGNVGVGVSGTSLDRRLTVLEGATGSAISILSTAGNVGGLIGTTGEALGQNGLLLNANRASGKIVFHTNSTERLRITSAGLVGIGTSTPNTELNVVGTIRAHAAVGSDRYIEMTPAGGISYITASSATTYPSIAFRQVGSSPVREVMRIDVDGRLGIGSTSVVGKLQVNQSADNEGITLSNSDRGSSYVQQRLAGVTNEGHSFAHYNGTNTAVLNGSSRTEHYWNINDTERARIDSSGRLLVGTSSSLATKYVTSSFQPGLQSAAVVGTAGLFRYSNNPDGPALVFSKSRSDTLGTQSVVSSGDTVGFLGFTGSDGTAFQTAALIFAQVDGIPGANGMPGRIVLSTTPSGSATPVERMRITAAGQVGIGLTPTEALHVSGNILATGNVTAFSDIRVKDNVESVTNGLEAVLQLRAVTYTRKGQETEGRQLGLIAQEVEPIVPEVVKTHEDGMKSLAYSNLVALLIEAIKEQQSQIDELRAFIKEN